jgi:hypothetical protein
MQPGNQNRQMVRPLFQNFMSKPAERFIVGR